MIEVRKVTPDDFSDIFLLYQKVAVRVGGIARLENEISSEYVKGFMNQSLVSGIELVAFDIDNPKKILAEIHCFSPQPSVFSHVLSEMSIVVDPAVQGKGVGKLLFNSLLDQVKTLRKDILRLELVVRESNHKAIAFYRSINFKIEGRMERRIDLRNGEFEADIPMAWFNPEFDNPYLDR